ncbi:MAG: hypothetical protein ACR2H1_00055, partial [Limisphaerales bacterium]
DNNTWSPPGLLIGFGDTFSFVFNSVGTFSYRDTFDGFTGTVTVVNPNTPLPALISSPTFSSNGFRFNITGVSNNVYVVEASTNLGNTNGWMAISTNQAPSPTFSFTDSTATNFSKRFYRVQSR